MEATKRKPPSFPPNYVTLVQLQERWMKQKEQEQQQQQQKQQENQKDDVNERRRRQRTEEPQMAVSACVVSSESEITEKKEKKKKKEEEKKSNEGKYWKRKDWKKNGGGGGLHAPERASVEEKCGVLADPTVEIEGKLQGMSINGGNEKFVRPRSGSYLNRGKNSSSSSRYRRLTKSGRGMIWVKKGDNVGGAQVSN